MSSPTRGGRGGYDDRLTFAPPWARERGPANLPARQTRKPVQRLPFAPQPMLELSPESLQTPEIAPFEGDVAIKELRRQLALHPDGLPEPAHPARPLSIVRLVARAAVAIMLAAIAAVAAIVAFHPDTRDPPPASTAATASGAGAPPAGDAPGQVPLSEASPVRRLIAKDRRGPVNAPLALGLSLDGVASGAFVVISGLAAGTRLASAEPAGQGTWRVAAADVGSVEVHAPQGFVGAMDAIVDLRLADGAIADSRVVRLEWAATPLTTQAKPQTASAQPDPSPPASAPPRAVSPEEVAVLLKRGHDFLMNGDIPAARLVLRRAAETGSAHAALALGASYDPAALKQAGVVGIAPDVAEARKWYRKAADLGSAEATRRLADLASR